MSFLQASRDFQEFLSFFLFLERDFGCIFGLYPDYLMGPRRLVGI
jgi:hypothetical protein